MSLSAVPVVTAQSGNLAIAITGMAITLSFAINHDNPTVLPENITWLFTSRFIPDITITVGNNSQYSFSSDRRSLTIRNITLRDDGEYQLVAVNDAGNNSDYIRLTVNGMHMELFYSVFNVNIILKLLNMSSHFS